MFNKGLISRVSFNDLQVSSFLFIRWKYTITVPIPGFTDQKYRIDLLQEGRQQFPVPAVRFIIFGVNRRQKGKKYSKKSEIGIIHVFVRPFSVQRMAEFVEVANRMNSANLDSFRLTGYC